MHSIIIIIIVIIITITTSKSTHCEWETNDAIPRSTLYFTAEHIFTTRAKTVLQEALLPLKKSNTD